MFVGPPVVVFQGNPSQMDQISRGLLNGIGSAIFSPSSEMYINKRILVIIRIVQKVDCIHEVSLTHSASIILITITMRTRNILY